MRAVQVEAPGKVHVIDVPMPTAGPGEVLLKTLVVGMCGTDLSTFRGKNPLVSYPRIPGHEIAAEIVSVGSDVPDHMVPGTKVTLSLSLTSIAAQGACASAKPRASTRPPRGLQICRCPS